MALHPYSKGQHNHAITAKTYIDATARDADLAWQKTSNIGKVVKTEDDTSFHILLSVGPTVWVVLAGLQGDLAAADISCENIVADAVLADSYSVKSLNPAPASASATGTLGEIRFGATYIYVCVATDTWLRAALTWA